MLMHPAISPPLNRCMNRNRCICYFNDPHYLHDTAFIVFGAGLVNNSLILKQNNAAKISKSLLQVLHIIHFNLDQ